jgi:electron transport complex protein RnfB
MVILEISAVGKIFVAIGLMVGLAVILGISIAFVSQKFSIKEDPRKSVLLGMMPGANCGGCGYPGCSGLVDAVIDGKVTKIKTCKVISEPNAQKAADYINSTPGPDGKTLKVTVK